MSLLMDALKRAEKARQAEADRSRTDGESRDTEATGLSLHPIEEEAPTELSGQAPPPAGSDTEDSLELTPPEVRREIESMAADPDLEGVSGRDDEAPGRDAAGTPDDSLSLSLDYGDIPLDETGATLPSMRAAQRSVQDYFDGTHSMSMSMEDVSAAIASERDAPPPSPSPESGADTIESDTTSRRRAQTVLDARAIAPSNTGRNVALVLLVLLVAGLGAAGFMFKDHIIAVFDGRPSVVAQRPPPPRAEPAPASTAASAASEQAPATLAADERDALLRAADAARAEERALADAAAAAQAQMQAQAEASAAAAAASADAAPAQAPAPAGSAAGGSTPDGAAPSAPASSQADARAADEPAPVALSEVLAQDSAAAAELPPSPGLRISRRSAPRRTHADLMQAFDAFQRGDDGSAMSAYQRILARDPRNRDAMLGTAAVYMRGQAWEQAARQYLEVLRRYPRDPVAQAALISMQDDIDPVAGETRIKSLLNQNPDDPNLQFSLGNLYAQQGRWPEAQQAYFAAYGLDGDNPDYAFNLAVSLDRLGQRTAAREYYARAGALADVQPASFDPEQARARLAALDSR